MCYSKWPLPSHIVKCHLRHLWTCECFLQPNICDERLMVMSPTARTSELGFESDVVGYFQAQLIDIAWAHVFQTQLVSHRKSFFHHINDGCLVKLSDAGPENRGLALIIAKCFFYAAVLTEQCLRQRDSWIGWLISIGLRCSFFFTSGKQKDQGSEESGWGEKDANTDSWLCSINNYYFFKSHICTVCMYVFSDRLATLIWQLSSVWTCGIIPPIYKCGNNIQKYNTNTYLHILLLNVGVGAQPVWSRRQLFWTFTKNTCMHVSDKGIDETRTAHFWAENFLAKVIIKWGSPRWHGKWMYELLWMYAQANTSHSVFRNAQ